MTATRHRRHATELKIRLAEAYLNGRVADLTYIRLRTQFAYFAAILDTWSRKVVGYALASTQ